MITAFEVGSIFRIVDQASPVLRAMLKSAVQLDRVTASIQKNLSAIASAKLVAVGAEIKSIAGESAAMNRELSASARSMGRLTKASSGLSGAAAAIASVSAATQTLALEWANVAAQSRAAVASMRAAGRVRMLPPVGGGALPPPLPGAGGRGRGGHGRNQGFHFGRWGASVPVLGGHVHASAPSSAEGVAAGAALFSIYELGRYGMEPSHAEAKLALLGSDDGNGLSATDRQRMMSAARDIAIAVPGSGYVHNLETMGELYSIVGAEGALAIAPRLAELDRVQAQVGGKGKDQGSAYVLTRATELMGQLTDPTTHKVDLARFGTILDTMSRLSIATHGKITPEEWLNYAKQAGPASGALTEEGLYTTAAIIQAMGGNRAGTAAAAMARQFAGGVMTKSKADELTKLGIFKEGDYTVEKGGHVQFRTDAASGFVDRLQHDPLTAIVTDLIPALESHGFTTTEAISKEIYKIIGTGPAQREVYELIRGREQIRQERERAMGAAAPGAAAAVLNHNDPEQVMGAFSTAFKDLIGALGGPLAVASIPAMQSLTSVFNSMSKAASEHKGITGIVGTTAAGAAGGAAIGFGVGWLGGPVGAGGGAAAGAALGAGYGIWNQLPQSVRTGLSTASSTSMGMLVPPAIRSALSLWGLASGSSAHGLSVMPPQPQEVRVEPAPVSVYLDMQKVGELVVKYITRQGSGAPEGAPYHDATHSFAPPDFTLAF